MAEESELWNNSTSTLWVAASLKTFSLFVTVVIILVDVTTVTAAADTGVVVVRAFFMYI